MSNQRPVSSRLAKRETSKAIRQTILIVLLTIGLGIAFLVLVLPAVIKFTVPNTGTPLGGDTDAPQVPLLSAPIPATFSAQVAISGYGEKESEVVLVVNGVEISKQPVTSDDGLFTMDAPITEGENSISLFAQDSSGNKSALSKSYTVIMDATAPTIEIESPANGSTIELTKNQLTTIKGKTEPNASVTVDGRTVRANTEGIFTTTKQLAEGENKISILATDSAGNQSTIELTLTFKR